MADLEEVRAAVSNLIENAVKYSGKDVHVQVETEQVDGLRADARARTLAWAFRKPS